MAQERNIQARHPPRHAPASSPASAPFAPSHPLHVFCTPSAPPPQPLLHPPGTFRRRDRTRGARSSKRRRGQPSQPAPPHPAAPHPTPPRPRPRPRPTNASPSPSPEPQPDPFPQPQAGAAQPGDDQSQGGGQSAAAQERTRARPKVRQPAAAPPCAQLCVAARRRTAHRLPSSPIPPRPTPAPPALPTLPPPSRAASTRAMCSLTASEDRWPDRGRALRRDGTRVFLIRSLFQPIQNSAFMCGPFTPCDSGERARPCWRARRPCWRASASLL